ncbi:hypothetical protein ASF21_08905 [Arthrobacter sp. Leaf234]|uniref:glycoside hydrolase family 16 protein n=1 Tax=Arthrobacter sp. Leaf234 TaxID=1736303 RepID=UPI0007011C45|nr:glycoside hydrolase family 16 protein [Arthrobacter sp. Leaf234]KQO01708.1 hypothetical protein ASF21_08905 [Arthrobacter sp. Leaf234]
MLRRPALRSALSGVLAALLLAVSVPTPVVAADTTPMAAVPGPVGDFAWKGLNWEKRWWSGAPNYNKQFDPANVSSPDADGHVTMTLSNPTGAATIGAEFNTTRHGFGYGTYSTTIEKDLTTLQKEVVWGCLFTYDPAVAPGYNEMDLCEASSWGGGSNYGQVWPITQGHGYWFDASKGPGVGNDTAIFGVTDHPILTHRLVWEPDRLTFETFAGEGYGGPLLKRTVMQGPNVPEPARETIHFNLWVTDGGGGDPAAVKPEKVVVRDFSFTPAPVTAPTPSPTAPAPSPSASPSATPTKPAPSPSASPTAAPTRPAPSPSASPTAVPTRPAPSPSASPTATPTKPAPSPTPTKPLPKPKPKLTVQPKAITLSARNTTAHRLYATTLTWSRAQGSTVTLVADGSRRPVVNSGRVATSSKTPSARYQICDASRCSPIVLGGR